MERGEHEVSGQCSFNGDLGGFLVAGLSNKDHVRILPQESAENTGKVQTDIRVCLYLAQAREIVFDGIFSGGYIDFGRVDLSQRAVERCGLTGTGWTGDVNNSIRLADHPSQLLHRSRVDN